MLICSGTWFIINGGSSAKDEGWLSSTSLKIPTKLDDPYFTVVLEDNPPNEGDKPYFVHKDNVLTTAQEQSAYTGYTKILTITDEGAKALYGVNTAAEAAGKYEVSWAGGIYAVQTDERGAIKEPNNKSVAAGTHYYNIIDKETGQVLFYKYKAEITQAKLTKGTISSDASHFDGDELTVNATWTPESAIKGNDVSMPYTYDTPAEFPVDGTTTQTVDQTAPTISKSILVTYMKDNGDKFFDNNFDIDNSVDANGTYSISAQACSTDDSKYYGTVVKALDKKLNATTTIIAMPVVKDVTGTPACKHVIEDKTDKVVEVGTNVTLLIPFDVGFDLATYKSANADTKLTYDRTIIHGGDTVDGASAANNDAVKNPTRFRKNQVTIKQGNTFKVNGTVTISATVSGGNGGQLSSIVAGFYSEILMEKGTLSGSTLTAEPAKMEVHGTVKSYGFISKEGGTGADKPTVTLNESAKLIGILSIVEHRGGSVFSDMIGSTSNPKPIASPFNRFYVRSITSEVIVKYGAKVYGFYDLKFGGGTALGIPLPIVHTSSDLPLIGNDETFFLQMKEGALLTFTCDIDNGEGNKKNVVYAKGSMAVNPITVEINTSLANVEISTETVFLPISHYWHIDFDKADGATSAEVNFLRQDVKILPGGYIKIHSGVTALAGSLAVYESASQIPAAGNFNYASTYTAGGGGDLIIDGTLRVSGGLGGNITTQSAGAKIEFDSKSSPKASSTPTELNKDSSGADSVFLPASGLVQTSSTVPTDSTDLSVRTYASSDTNVWYHYNITVTYVDGEASSSEQFDLSAPGLKFEKDTSCYPSLNKEHYVDDAGVWCTDKALSASALGTTVYDDVTVYAKRTPVTYDVIFESVGAVGAPTITKTTFDITTVNILNGITPESSADFTFMDWYSAYSDDGDSSNDAKIASGAISGQELINIGKTDGVYKIYAKWEAGTVVKNTITYTSEGGMYQNEFGFGRTTFDTLDELKASTLLDVTGNDNNLSKTHYFLGWYLNGVGDPITDIATMVDQNGGTEFTLVAKWAQKKYTVNIVGATSTSGISIDTETIHFNDNQKELLFTGTGYGAEVTKFDSNQTVKVAFNGWRDASNNLITSSSNLPIGTSTLTPEWTDKLEITVTLTNATVTIGTTKYTASKTAYIKSGDKLNITAEYNKNSKQTLTVDGTKDFTNPYEFKSPVVVVASSEDGECFATGTLLTLADGTRIPVEDLKPGDILRVFNHETGTYTYAPILFIENDGVKEYNVINLIFSDGTHTKLIYEHGLFDLDLNKYVYITEENYAEFIGHRFAKESDNGYEIVVLEQSYVEKEVIGCYSLTTNYHMNYFIDGLFSMPGGITGLFNYFEYGENLGYDQEKMQADIEKYGLYTAEDFAEYLPEELFNEIYPVKYLKVSVEKGLMTFEDILAIIERYVKGHELM